MAETTRKECRKALTLFEKADLSDLVDPDWVLDHQRTDFEGVSPVVQVTSVGLDHEPVTFKGGKGLYFLSVESFVLHKHVESGWTEADAEDLIDDIAHEIVASLVAHKTDGPWHKLVPGERTLVSRVKVSGLDYLYEVFPVTLEVI